MPIRNPSRFAAVGLAALVLGACATTETKHRDWSTYDGPMADELRKPEVEYPRLNDPMEPMNRGIGMFNAVVLTKIASPIASVWNTVIPKPVRTGLANVGTNLLFPVRVVNNSLQGRWADAGTETERFFLNTTVGVLGWNDYATDNDVPAPDRDDKGSADTGGSLAVAGWKDPAYLTLPLVGPSSTRDGVGFIGDSLLNPMTYFSPASPVNTFNQQSEAIPKVADFIETTYDPYRLGRLLSVTARKKDVDGFTFKKLDEGTGTETLQFIFMAPRNSDFVRKQEDSSVQLKTTGKSLSYTYFLQPEPAPVVFVLPGLGGHRNATASHGLAEIAYEAGNNVVIISNAFNFEFIEQALTSELPGLPQSDAADIHHAFTAIDAQLREEYPGRLMEKRGVFGISMGAFHAMFLAARKQQGIDENLIPLDRFVAVNPPVDLFHGMKKLDEFYNLPLQYYPDEDDRNRKITALLRHVIELAKGKGGLRPGKKIPISNKAAEFLIGVVFRLTAVDVIEQTQRMHDQGVLLTPGSTWDRSARVAEIIRYGWTDYLAAFVLPYLSRTRKDITLDDKGADRVRYLASLSSIDDQLMFDNRVHVFTNKNDFLLRSEDVSFLEMTFGRQLHMSSAGGHLGNLITDKVRLPVEKALKGLWWD